MSGWIGVDVDGTLVTDTNGQPVPAMVARIRRWLAEGREVRLVTARAAIPLQHGALHEWSLHNFGVALPVTDRKDFDMLELWDDRAVAVERNTGRRLSPSVLEQA